MPGPDRSRALEHIVVMLFENRSLDNVLGRLYGPGDGKTFDGVIGKDLSNPIPAWAEHGADRQVVPYTVATDMDAPNPDSGEEFYHTNTQLYGVLDDHNRFKLGEAVTAPWNAPPPGAVPTMDGFVADYISTFTGEMGRQPTYEEYAHIMTGCTPEQLPVLNGIARDFGVFDQLCGPGIQEMRPRQAQPEPGVLFDSALVDDRQPAQRLLVPGRRVHAPPISSGTIPPRADAGSIPPIVVNPSSALQEPQLTGPRDRLVPGGDAELAVGRPHLRLDGVRRQEQLPGDLRGRQVRGQQRQQPELGGGHGRRCDGGAAFRG
jgi:Phosphoesterase family